MSTLHGPTMTMRVYVDNDHACDLVTRCSWMGFIVFLVINPPIYWSSKKQGSCETHVAMKQATEHVRGLCFKLRMIGITVDEPAFIFGDLGVHFMVLGETTRVALWYLETLNLP